MKNREQLTAKDLENERGYMMNTQIIDNKIIYDVDYKQKYEQVLILLGIILLNNMLFIGITIGLIFFI